LAFGVLSRDSPKNGHVGVVRGTDGQGNPILVSGNHGPTVTQSVYPKSEVMAYVMPPNYVIEDMAAAARAAADRSVRTKRVRIRYPSSTPGGSGGDGVDGDLVRRVSVIFTS